MIKIIALKFADMIIFDYFCKRIDEKIFFYIPDKLADATEREIISFIENNLN